MTDMRQKLLPVFLEEASRKILQLEEFLETPVDGEPRLTELEAAFRAAHTLKGTAALVQAEAICTLSARIEGMLEGHFEQGRFPSKVEYEAMRLAVDRLKTLKAAVANGQEEAADVLSEAEMALKLASSMPGRRTLKDLLQPDTGDDPFADDSAFDEVAKPVTSAVPDDPFVDDPPLDPSLKTSVTDDPFAEDPVLEPVPSADIIEPRTLLANDPFADDPQLETEPTMPGPLAGEDSTSGGDPFAGDPVLEGEAESQSTDSPEEDLLKDRSASQKTDAEELSTSNSPSLSAPLGQLPEDPFAEDPELGAELGAEPVADVVVEELPVTPVDSYAERMRKRLETESAVGTAQRLAATLQHQDGEQAAERNIHCCRFYSGSKEYYLPIANMVEVADLPAIIRLPLAPPVVQGLINLRGRVLPVIDLSAQTDEPNKFVAVRKLVVAETNGELLAFMTDGIPDLSEEIHGEKVDVASFIAQFRAGAS